ncbi:MAG: glutamine--fructose-6-phosphate aminotransferase, partial [Planctomycetota bacterium]
MCGIFGYIGDNNACPFLVTGLQRLEYRGYDSAGVATLQQSDGIRVTKVAGRVAELESAIDEKISQGSLGIGHTRWATHGAANQINAHPHSGGTGILSLAHNGVIENYESIKLELQNKGYQFVSET